jgi:hypothetical protein
MLRHRPAELLSQEVVHGCVLLIFGRRRSIWPSAQSLVPVVHATDRFQTSPDLSSSTEYIVLTDRFISLVTRDRRRRANSRPD